MNLIKRYRNRKMYSTVTCCYITTRDIINMVRRGREFKIIDHKGQDITKKMMLSALNQPNALKVDELAFLLRTAFPNGVYDLPKNQEA